MPVLRRMMGFLGDHRRLAIISCSLLVLKIVIEVIAVYFLSPVITTISQNLSVSHPTGFWNWITGTSPSARDLRSVLTWMALSQIALSVMTYLRSVWDTKFSQGVVTSMREKVYDQLQHLEFSFYDRMTSGKLMSRALGDLDTVHGFVNMSVLSILDIVVSITAYLALLSWRSPWLLGAALLPLPLWCWIIFRFSKRSGPLYQKQRDSMDALTGVLTENIAGRHVVRAFGSSRFESEKFQARNGEFLNKFLAVVKWQATLNPCLQSLAIAAHITIFFVCAFLIQKGLLPIGDLLILGAAIGTILGKLQHINGIAETYQRALVSGERLFEILDSLALRPREHGRAELQQPRGDVTFEGVSFSYEPSKPVLNSLSCRMPGGQVTAIVGPTGSGKSTLSALLACFYEADQGKITIGGQAITEVNLHSLRHHVGFVFQETFLFSDTIRNNIRYGRMDVSDEMLIQAAKVSHADDFIKALPEGYETRIGEGGVQLSGGQRQRLALARALVYEPEILILDDAMAALDASTESAIRERLRELRRGRTVIMITHRPSSLTLADHVLVMEHGQVIQSCHPAHLRLAEVMTDRTLSPLLKEGFA